MVTTVGTAMSVSTIDFDAAFADLMAARDRERRARLTPPLVRFWDGNWDLRGRVERIITANVVEKNNETGTAVFTLPLDYYISEWIIDFENRTEVIHCTVDKDGVRWSGRMEEFAVVKMEDGSDHLRIAFKHDYEELKKLIVFPNPFLMPEVQFPRLWLAFGTARFACKLTALLNIMRVEGHFWQMPDDPLDAAQWPIGGPSTWWMVVKPDAIGNDRSPLALVHSRMKSVHEATKSICEDAQLTWTFRRFLKGEDEPPWPGANLRHGCLVIDLEDKGNRFGETSMGGDLFGGLIRQKTTVGNDGMTEGVDIIKDPDFPAEYSDPNWQGTMPRAPWVTYRDGVHTAIAASEFSMKPATAVQIVAGGHSMPFVNEIISQTIQLVGDLTAMIPFVPPLGGVADAVLKPLYSDTLLAFGATKVPGRAARLGRNHYREQFQDGADRAYTLGYILAQRLGAFTTERKIGHELTVVDAPYKIGQRGLGHFYIGDRVGTTVRGMQIGKIFVDQVTEVGLEWSREKAATWKITLGHREPTDPVIQAFKKLQDMLGALHELGML
ncbi:phage tail protein [Nocardia sp. NPDC051570]|uniref:Gp37-like protein n=1 Tax=Nocardia sp. NPDC051570 TaxID=3364324 RepID=UPI003797C7B9